MTETFYYENSGSPGENYSTESALWMDRRSTAERPLTRLLDVLRAKGILTGWDVCDVLGEGWEPCSSDMPPPWDPTP